MRGALLLLAALLAGAARAQPASRAPEAAPLEDYAPVLTEVLRAVVTADGLVRYDLLARAPHLDRFRRVLRSIETFDARTLRDDRSKLAFWMNAYNVQMLQNMLEHPRLENILRKSDTFFRTPRLIAGHALTLDEIEHGLLRRQQETGAFATLRVSRLDPRIHVGLNCAAISCPRLRSVAFTPANVDAELDAAMRDFTASERHFRVEGSAVVVSSLLDWYGADLDEGGKAGDYLLRFMPRRRPGYEELRAALSGRSASQIKDLPNIMFEYLWFPNRAPTR